MVDISRRLRPLAMAALLAILACCGCAAWHYRKEAAASDTSSSSKPDDGGVFRDVLQGLQNASMNDWNFGRSGLW